MGQESFARRRRDEAEALATEEGTDTVFGYALCALSIILVISVFMPWPL